MNTNQNLLLLTIQELSRNNHHLRFLRSRCSGYFLDDLLSRQQKILLSLEWEGRTLAAQRGMDLPEVYTGCFLFPFGWADGRIVQNWCHQNRESLIRCRRALRRYDRTDPVSLLCQKFMDFCTQTICQMETYL